jgi:hypothetical protein
MSKFFRDKHRRNDRLSRKKRDVLSPYILVWWIDWVNCTIPSIHTSYTREMRNTTFSNALLSCTVYSWTEWGLKMTPLGIGRPPCSGGWSKNWWIERSWQFKHWILAWVHHQQTTLLCMANSIRQYCTNYRWLVTERMNYSNFRFTQAINWLNDCAPCSW